MDKGKGKMPPDEKEPGKNNEDQNKEKLILGSGSGYQTRGKRMQWLENELASREFEVQQLQEMLRDHVRREEQRQHEEACPQWEERKRRQVRNVQEYLDEIQEYIDEQLGAVVESVQSLQRNLRINWDSLREEVQKCENFERPQMDAGPSRDPNLAREGPEEEPEEDPEEDPEEPAEPPVEVPVEEPEEENGLALEDLVPPAVEPEEWGPVPWEDMDPRDDSSEEEMESDITDEEN